MRIILHRYVADLFSAICRIIDEDQRTRSREFYLLLVSKSSKPDEVYDVRIPEQEIYGSLVRAKGRSISTLASELGEDEVFCGSLHRHPFATSAFLSATDEELLETMAQEMSPRMIRWSSTSETLPTLRCHLPQDGHLIVDGREIQADQIE
ncbi:TPA: hypothetical protein ENG04_00475, partial [Candidatus Poribacteria bacterium]|nr:hypothetical protein [Candidatus Poribacteria bacterium]HEX28539.1 hypothetical protein [Candidatus Poribacteria bacterium]